MSDLSPRDLARLRDAVARRRIDKAELDDLERQRLKRTGSKIPDAVRATGLAVLSLKQREALELWAEGYSMREIGVELGICASNVCGRVHTAQRRLGLTVGGSSRDRRLARALLAGVEVAA